MSVVNGTAGRSPRDLLATPQTAPKAAGARPSSGSQPWVAGPDDPIGLASARRATPLSDAHLGRTIKRMRSPSRPVLAVLTALLLRGSSGSGGGSDVRSGGTTPMSASGGEPDGDLDPLAAGVEAVLARLDRRPQVLQLFLVGVRFPDIDGDGGVELACRASAGSSWPAAPTVRSPETAAVTSRWLAAAPRRWIDRPRGRRGAEAAGPGFAALPPAVEQGWLLAGRLAALAPELGSSLRQVGLDLDLLVLVFVVGLTGPSLVAVHSAEASVPRHVATRSEPVVLSVTDATTVAHTRPATSVATYWQGNADAPVALAFSFDGVHFGTP